MTTSSIHQIRRILLPIDESPGTQAAVDYAVLLAESLGAAITLVHVDVPGNSMVAMVPGATVAGDLAAAHTTAAHRLAEIVDRLAARGFHDVTTRVKTAPEIARAIVTVARDGGYDLIVMGTHGRTGVSRLVLGSVAEQVLRHASCPVLTVHLPPDP